MPFEIRYVRDDAEYDAWRRASAAMFGEVAGPVTDLEEKKRLMPLDRAVTAFDGERVVGTAGSYQFEMTLPGGGTIPVAGVADVTVSSTHRRQGILRQMMERQLDDLAAGGEPVAVLNASETAIYGRFGYGIAQLYQRYEIDRAKTAFARSVPERSRPMRLVTRDEARKELPSIYEVCRLRRPGMLSQSEAWWEAVLNEKRTWKGGGDLYIVVADADQPRGTGPGYALYRIDNSAVAGRWKLSVFDVEAADHVVEAQLFRYLLDVDLVGTVIFEGRPLDCPLRWWMQEVREARVTHVGDYLWVRVLDIERSLASRRYAVDDEVVVMVADPFRPGASGRYRVAGGRDGAECARTHRPAQLALEVSELGAIYLGQMRPSDLAAAGRVSELEPGALARADRLFGWPVAPYCATRF